ncbi:MAG: hypothetical protein O3C40_16855 [Planctomycetota bacterium]|nr:hypothetical protein [Planctomycetota bacterium]
MNSYREGEAPAEPAQQELRPPKAFGWKKFICRSRSGGFQPPHIQRRLEATATSMSDT